MDRGPIHVTTYHKGIIAMTSWDNNGIWIFKAPQSGIIDAYGGAIRRHGRAQKFEGKVSLSEIETISSIKRTADTKMMGVIYQ